MYIIKACSKHMKHLFEMGGVFLISILTLKQPTGILYIIKPQ